MEGFVNPTLGKCVVEARKDDVSLIKVLGNKYFKFCVALGHKKGDNDWVNGKYFKKLKDAKEYYEGVVE